MPSNGHSLKSPSPSLVIGLVAVVVVGLSIAGALPGLVPFKHLDKQSIFGILTWLFVVALFVERAVEVIVSVLRDQGADSLQHAVDTAQAKINEQAKATPNSVAYLGPLHDAQEALINYRGVTKGIALSTGFVLGIFVSVAGVRAFSSIVDAVPAGNWEFNAVDIIITGAVIAGGTDAIHQMMNVFTNFLNSTADKASK